MMQRVKRSCLNRVILGLGSNVGDRIAYLKSAINLLKNILQDVVVSSIYKTSPQDYFLQDDFYNAVLLGFYDDVPQKLLDEIQEIERMNARDRKSEIPKGPRTLDIDILFFGNLELDIPTLTIPHPSIKKRAFVLVPLLELLPDFKWKGVSYTSFLPNLSDQTVEKIS